MIRGTETKEQDVESHPTVSVVITNYNYDRYLAGAVDSARAADEIIVVDDGSTDHSREIINALSNVTPIFKSNGGHATAINAGFAASRGDVVVFLDADDHLGKNCIAEVKANWTSAMSKLQWGLWHIDESGRRRGRLYPHFTDRHTPEWCRAEMRRRSWYAAPPTSGNAWSRSFLERVVPIPQLGSVRWAPDDYMHLLAPYFGDVVSLTDVYGEYRVHAGQLSGLSEFSVDWIESITSDEVLRYQVVGDVLVRLGHRPPDALRWSRHTMNRLFVRRLGRSRESIWPLIARHITATLREDAGLRHKAKRIVLGLLLLILPYQPLVLELAAKEYRY